jgi:hypothetical protein
VAPIDESLGHFQVLLVFVGVIKALGVDGSNYAQTDSEKNDSD